MNQLQIVCDTLEKLAQALPIDKPCMGVKQGTYKIGDKVRMTTLTWGELITDRKGKPIHQTASKDVYEGVVKFAGPEAAFKGAVEVVRCNGGNKALKLNNGFQFYPKDNGPEQVVEILMPAPQAVTAKKCKYGDPLCPCQDGHQCHYEGKDAWPAPQAVPAGWKLLSELTPGEAP
jgi:hypothetical protein